MKSIAASLVVTLWAVSCLAQTPDPFQPARKLVAQRFDSGFPPGHDTYNGMGTGSDSGRKHTALGRDGFTKLVHYAYDQGIRYFDCAQSYVTFEWIADAIKGLPREKLFLQSKIGGKPADVLAAIAGADPAAAAKLQALVAAVKAM